MQFVRSFLLWYPSTQVPRCGKFNNPMLNLEHCNTNMSAKLRKREHNRKLYLKKRLKMRLGSRIISPGRSTGNRLIFKCRLIQRDSKVENTEGHEEFCNYIKNISVVYAFLVLMSTILQDDNALSVSASSGV